VLDGVLALIVPACMGWLEISFLNAVSLSHL
jgi:hypothetical protein